jgi:predicted O-methyltransferase YrrM
MAENSWGSVDQYINGLLVAEDEALASAVMASASAGLPSIQVSPAQGKFLHLLARIQRAREILEIGTLGGYSTIWLARALAKGGRLVTIEADPKHAAVARSNFERAGLTPTIDLREGKALDVLPIIASEKRAPFDLIFIDADKAGIPDYFAWALKLSRAGTVIVVDNVIRNGAVIDAASSDPSVLGVRKFNEHLSVERRVSATTLQTVGSKGYDGFTLAVVDSV